VKWFPTIKTVANAGGAAVGRAEKKLFKKEKKLLKKQALATLSELITRNKQLVGLLQASGKPDDKEQADKISLELVTQAQRYEQLVADEQKVCFGFLISF
jgi:hypothetical protein